MGICLHIPWLNTEITKESVSILLQFSVIGRCVICYTVHILSVVLTLSLLHRICNTMLFNWICFTYSVCYCYTFTVLIILCMLHYTCSTVLVILHVFLLPVYKDCYTVRVCYKIPVISHLINPMLVKLCLLCCIYYIYMFVVLYLLNTFCDCYTCTMLFILWFFLNCACYIVLFILHFVTLYLWIYLYLSVWSEEGL